MTLSIRRHRPGATHRRRVRRGDPDARLTHNPRPWHDLPAGHQGAGLR